MTLRASSRLIFLNERWVAKDESQASELKVLEQEEKQEAKDAKEAPHWWHWLWCDKKVTIPQPFRVSGFHKKNLVQCAANVWEWLVGMSISDQETINKCLLSGNNYNQLQIDVNERGWHCRFIHTKYWSIAKKLLTSYQFYAYRPIDLARCYARCRNSEKPS